MEKVKVIISDRQHTFKVPTGIRMLIRRCCAASLAEERFQGSAEVSVSFLDNAQIRQLNAEFRNIDSATDVLSFPLGQDGVYDVNPDTGAKLLGDIVISLERADEQAKAFGHSLRREIGFLTVHSMFHLLGCCSDCCAHRCIGLPAAGAQRSAGGLREFPLIWSIA